jgi:carboxyl-terminal processing protease
MRLRLLHLFLFPSWLAMSSAFATDMVAQSAALASYQRIQLARTQAKTMSGKNANQAALQSAVKRLETELMYLDTPRVQEQAIGYQPLHFRGHDIRIDLASLYARLNMREQALTTLEQMQRFAWIPAVGQLLSADSTFDTLRDEPRFTRILQRAALPDRLWQGPAADVPYKDQLSVEERIAGLSLFWAEARANFAYFDQVPELDWNRVYLDFLPKVMAAGTTVDYYRVLMQLAPLLMDGHTNIFPPKELVGTFFSRPPLTARLIGDKVVIEAVRSNSLAQRIHPGEEVIAIDGMAVHSYAAQNVAPFVSSSTPQDKAVRMYSYQLFSGDANKRFKLSLRNGAGIEREEIIARTGYTDIAPASVFAFRTLSDGIVYFSLDHFDNSASLQAFERILPQVMQAKALIIDVRNNGGGSTAFANSILSYLTDKPIPAAQSLVRSDDLYARAMGMRAVMWQAPTKFEGAAALPHAVFTGKIAVLTGPKTFSAAEDFLLAFNALKRGITVGETSGGSTGQPLVFMLPGGGSGRICIKRDALPDGSQFVGKGISPTVNVAPSLASLREGRDPVLERAIVELQRPATP